MLTGNVALAPHSFVGIAAAAAKSLQSRLTLCHPIDSSPPGSPVPGILQARTLEWAAISLERYFSQKEDNQGVLRADAHDSGSLVPRN